MLKTDSEQLDKYIAIVLGRMGELLDKYSIPSLLQTDYGKYGSEFELGRRWINPQAENTYKNYVRILTELNERKLQNGEE